MDYAHIILYDTAGRVCLQHRDGKAPTNPNTVGLFGGAIEQNETPLTAVYRECYEELGYNLNSPVLLGAFIINHVKRYVYIERYNGSSPLKCYEGKSMEWITNNDVKNCKNMLPIDKKILDKFYQSRKNHQMKESS